jgi:ABC-type sulfate transport system permease subunit
MDIVPSRDRRIFRLLSLEHAFNAANATRSVDNGLAGPDIWWYLFYGLLLCASGGLEELNAGGVLMGKGSETSELERVTSLAPSWRRVKGLAFDSLSVSLATQVSRYMFRCTDVNY